MDTLGNDCPPCSFVKSWPAELKRERTITEDEPRSFRPKDVTTDYQADAVHFLIMRNDSRVTIHYIANTAMIGFGSVQFIEVDKFIHLKKPLGPLLMNFGNINSVSMI